MASYKSYRNTQKPEDTAVYTDDELNKIMSQLFPDKGDPNATVYYWDADKNRYTSKKPVDYLSNVVNFNDFSQDLYNKYYGEASSGYGGYTPVKADISALLKAYEDKAASARTSAERTYADTVASLENSYNTTRSDLLTSLKRYQEQFAQDSKAQRQTFLSNQAALESTREAANRSIRNSMAVRGLGGSGLQQLALLQNVLGQSAEVSNLATQNQNTIDSLRRLLQQQEEDYDADIAKLQTQYDLNRRSALTDRDNLLNNIDSTLLSEKETAIANNEAQYAADVNAARAQAAAYQAQAQQNATNLSNRAVNTYNTVTADLASNLKELQSTRSSKTISEYANALGLTNNKGEAYSVKDIDKLSNSGINDLKQLIARTYAANANALISQASIDFGTPVAFNKTAYNNINNLLQGYGYNPYYTDSIINGNYIQP